MKDKLHKPHTSFKKEQKIFDDWRQFLNESAAPGMVALDEQGYGEQAKANRSMAATFKPYEIKTAEDLEDFQKRTKGGGSLIHKDREGNIRQNLDYLKNVNLPSTRDSAPPPRRGAPPSYSPKYPESRLSRLKPEPPELDRPESRLNPSRFKPPEIDRAPELEENIQLKRFIQEEIENMLQEQRPDWAMAPVQKQTLTSDARKAQETQTQQNVALRNRMLNALGNLSPFGQDVGGDVYAEVPADQNVSQRMQQTGTPGEARQTIQVDAAGRAVDALTAASGLGALRSAPNLVRARGTNLTRRPRRPTILDQSPIPGVRTRTGTGPHIPGGAPPRWPWADAPRNQFGNTARQQQIYNTANWRSGQPVSGRWPEGYPVPMSAQASRYGMTSGMRRKSPHSINRPDNVRAPMGTDPQVDNWWREVADTPARAVTPAGTVGPRGTYRGTPAPLVSRSEVALNPSRYPPSARVQGWPGKGDTLIPYRESLEHQVENYIYESGILKELLK